MTPFPVRETDRRCQGRFCLGKCHSMNGPGSDLRLAGVPYPCYTYIYVRTINILIMDISLAGSYICRRFLSFRRLVPKLCADFSEI